MTVDNHTALPPLPEPYSVASTIKCVACGEPYRPSIPVARPMFSGITTNACKCGGTTFGGTFVEGPSPAVYTADQLRTYGKECMRLALSSPAWVDLSAAPPSRKPLTPELQSAIDNVLDHGIGCCPSGRQIEDDLRQAMGLPREHDE